MKTITGHTFPLDVKKSRDTWKQAQTIVDEKERKKALSASLSFDAQPFAAKIKTEGTEQILVLTNRSNNNIAILKEPSDLTYEWTNGVGGGGSNHDELTKNDFSIIAPGASFRVKLNSEYMDRSKLKRLSVAYLKNGNKLGLNAWMGTIEVNINSK